MNISRITFPVLWHDGDGKLQKHLAEFKLGPSPCGKSVNRLEADLAADGSVFEVRQGHADGSWKTFTYLTRHITGRIETEGAACH